MEDPDDRERAFTDFAMELREAAAAAKAARTKKRSDGFRALLDEVGSEALLALAPEAPDEAGRWAGVPWKRSTRCCGRKATTATRC